MLCQAVVNSGHGDYVEIGSLHGGSAITAALTKKEFKLDGDIFCVEPNPRGIIQNAKLFGVDEKIFILQRPSDKVIWSQFDKFNCGFIDGDHRTPYPTRDWRSLEDKVTKHIIFDDYDKSEPGVEEAVIDAMDLHSGWRLVHCSDAMVIFEKE